MDIMNPRNITHVIVHNSDSLWGNADAIRHWHSDPPPKGNGWSDIGYHFVVCNQFPTATSHAKNQPVPESDGRVEPGRSIMYVGAHEEKYNKRSIGICLVGKDGNFTEAQMKAIRALIRKFMEALNIPASNVLGHAEVDPKKRDPGFDMDTFRASL